MNQLEFPLLSLMIFVPVAGAALLLFVRDAKAVRRIALAVSLIEIRLVRPDAPDFDTATPNMQFGEEHALDRRWNINYTLGSTGSASCSWP